MSAIIIALDNQNGPVPVGALRACSRDPVDVVLIVDGMLPEQPHRAAEMAEFRDYRTLSDVQGQMPALIVAGR